MLLANNKSIYAKDFKLVNRLLILCNSSIFQFYSSRVQPADSSYGTPSCPNGPKEVKFLKYCGKRKKPGQCAAFPPFSDNGFYPFNPLPHDLDFQ